MAQQKIASNKPGRNQNNTRAMAGPVKYKWKPLSFQKVKKPKSPDRVETCSDTIIFDIDNVVTYVYEILSDGNHSAYVDCDYVD